MRIRSTTVTICVHGIFQALASPTMALPAIADALCLRVEQAYDVLCLKVSATCQHAVGKCYGVYVLEDM